MKSTLLASTVYLLALGTFGQSAYAGPASDAAQAHFEAIAAGDLAKLSSAYADQARLTWVGGPLDGSYNGVEGINGVWKKFTTGQGRLKASVDHVEEATNPKGSTVTADVRFEGKQAIPVRYVLTYRDGKIADEVWQIAPKPATVSAIQGMSVANANTQANFVDRP